MGCRLSLWKLHNFEGKGNAKFDLIETMKAPVKMSKIKEAAALSEVQF